MHTIALISLAALSLASPSPRVRRQSGATALETNSTYIEQYWGQITPYVDNAENFFGVANVGLPDGCQVEQAHLLERHGARFPTSGFDDGANDLNFGQKVMNWTSVNKTQLFTGPLTFLNGYQNLLVDNGLLTSVGASQSFQGGVSFWQRYGRILTNATQGQLTYNASYPNGTARAKPVLRTTGQSRIENSEINWALGFFGSSFETTPNPNLTDLNSYFNVVVIPEGGTENNTLASYDSCFRVNDDLPGYDGDYILEAYLKTFLTNATARMQQYAPAGFTFTVNDTYAMQSICAYETNYIGTSDFCNLFTDAEWQGFELTLDQEYFYDYSFGNPTGRAQGIGYVQELIARLTNQYITSSNTSVNYTITNNAADFPLGRPFYADFSHDDILISVLTALSLDYLNDPPPINPTGTPNATRHFILSHLTPFAAKLVTEVIGCSSPNPTPQSTYRTYYSPQQYGYNPSNATNKFIRMRLNNGILPLNTIRGGYCNRTDGMCPMGSFLESQQDGTALANYQFVCFQNYTVNYGAGQNFDGNIFANGSSV